MTISFARKDDVSNTTGPTNGFHPAIIICILTFANGNFECTRILTYSRGEPGTKNVQHGAPWGVTWLAKNIIIIIIMKKKIILCKL